MNNIVQLAKKKIISNDKEIISESSAKYLVALILALLIGFGLAFLTGCQSQSSHPYSSQSTNRDQDDDFQAGADNPPSAQTLYAYANILEKQGKLPQSELILQKIIKDYPHYRPAYTSLAEIQVRKGYIDMAVNILEQALQNNPEDSIILNNIGMCQMIREDYAKALTFFTRAAAQVPDNARYRANAAVALGLQRRYEEALAMYQSILPSADAHYNLAVLCQTNQDDALADQHLKIAHQLNPSLALAAKQ